MEAHHTLLGNGVCHRALTSFVGALLLEADGNILPTNNVGRGPLRATDALSRLHNGFQNATTEGLVADLERGSTGWLFSSGREGGLEVEATHGRLVFRLHLPRPGFGEVQTEEVVDRLLEVLEERD